MEYAETEIMANELNTILKGSEVISVAYSHWFMRKIKDKPHWDFSLVVNFNFSHIYRIGKALVFELNYGRQSRVISSRLGVSGRWMIYYNDDVWPQSSWAATLYVSHKKFAKPIKLVYSDIRKLGSIEVREFRQECESLRIYGPEIKSSAFTLEWVRFVCSRHKVPIKSVLLRQEYFAGVGNWLASEILFSSHINPLKHSNKLTKDEIKRLFASIHLVINSAITSENNKEGDNLLHVYGRRGKSCYACGSLIKKVSINRRGTFFCPTCQSEDWNFPTPVSQEMVSHIVSSIS